MNFKIYIKKELEIDDFPSIYFVFPNNKNIFMLEVEDFTIITKNISKEELNNKYISLEEFLENAKYIGKVDSIGGANVLYNYDDYITLVNYDGNKIAFDYDEDYKFETPNLTKHYEYKEIYDYIIKQTGEIFKKNYVFIIEEILKQFNKINYVQELVKDIHVDNDKYYKYILELSDNYTLEELKLKFYRYLKKITLDIKNSESKNKMLDDALNTYNYLVKKLNK